MDHLNAIIKKLAAQVRAERKAVKDRYDRLCEPLEKIVADDLSIKREDLQQTIWDRRKDFWEFMFKEEYNDYSKLLDYLNKFTKLKTDEIKKDDLEFIKHLKNGTLHIYELKKR